MIKLYTTLFMLVICHANIGLGIGLDTPYQDESPGRFGKVEFLEVKQTLLIFNDGLEVSLVSFSHKHPRKGGPTKATAYLKVSIGEQNKDILLSVFGSADSNEKEYESKTWNGYKFELMALDYNESIELRITQVESKEH